MSAPTFLIIQCGTNDLCLIFFNQWKENGELGHPSGCFNISILWLSPIMFYRWTERFQEGAEPQDVCACVCVCVVLVPWEVQYFFKASLNSTKVRSHYVTKLTSTSQCAHTHIIKTFSQVRESEILSLKHRFATGKYRKFWTCQNSSEL